MGFRFRRRVSLFPGVRLNIGKSGITSFSFGKRGASVTVGKRGVFQNVGLPGTGLSYRTRLDTGAARVPRAAGGGGLWLLGLVMGVALLVASPLLFLGVAVAGAIGAWFVHRVRRDREELRLQSFERVARRSAAAEPGGMMEQLRRLGVLRDQGELTVRQHDELRRRLAR